MDFRVGAAVAGREALGRDTGKARPKLFVELIAVADPTVRHVELRPLALEQAAQFSPLGNPHVRNGLAAVVGLALDRDAGTGPAEIA